MSLLELLFAGGLVLLLYRMLRPLQRRIERALLQAMGKDSHGSTRVIEGRWTRKDDLHS